MARKHSRRRFVEMTADVVTVGVSTVVEFRRPGVQPATFEFPDGLSDSVKRELLRRIYVAADPLEEVRLVAARTEQGVICTIPLPDGSVKRIHVPRSSC